MVADARFKVTQPLRFVLASAMYPLQWLVMQPMHGLRFAGSYFQDLTDAQQDLQNARLRLANQTQKSSRVDQLELENQRLRQLLELRNKPETTGVAAQVVYDAADPFTRKIMIDKGQLQGIDLGAPVLDEFGVIGQVTRLHPLTSEVTLLIDRDHAIPVLNTRTGARSVAYGDPVSFGGTLELRFMAANADVQAGDVLTTSGVDGIYPAGLPVAKIDKIERRADTAFAKIHCAPIGKVIGASNVMILKPLTQTLPNTLTEKSTEPTSKKGGKR